MCRNVEVAEWSRDVSSGKERINVGDSRDRAVATFDGDELDHNDAETEAFVRAGLQLHLTGNGIAGDVKWV